MILGALSAPAVWLIRRRPPLEALAVGTGFGVLLWGGIALTRFFLLLPPGPPRTVGLLTLFFASGAILVLWRLNGGAPNKDRTRPAAGLVLAMAGCAALTLGQEALLPHFGAAQWAYDWWMHFDLAHFYQAPSHLHRVYEGGSVVSSRTPLYNLLGSLTLTLLGDRFTVFQVLTAAVGWLWVLPLALLANSSADKRATPIVALLGLSPLVLWAHDYTWPKGLVTFLLLLALERWCRLRVAPPDAHRRLSLEFGLLAGAAVMTHAGFAGYLLPLYGFLGWDAWRRRHGRARPALALAGAGLVALPWYAWAVAEYGWRQGLFGYPRPGFSNALAYLGDRLSILATSLLPVSFPVDRIKGALSPAQDYFLVYLGTAAGIAGVSFLVWALARLVSSPVGRRTLADAGGWFAISGMVIATLLLAPVAPDSAATLFIPGLLVLAFLVLRASRPPALLVAIALIEVCLFETAFLAWIWSGAAAGQPNAQQAAAQHITFLGNSAWPAGCALLLGGLAGCVAALRPWLRFRSRRVVSTERAA